MVQLCRILVFTLFIQICQANDPVQWPVVDGGNGHWYQLVVTMVTAVV